MRASLGEIWAKLLRTPKNLPAPTPMEETVLQSHMTPWYLPFAHDHEVVGLDVTVNYANAVQGVDQPHDVNGDREPIEVGSVER